MKLGMPLRETTSGWSLSGEVVKIEYPLWAMVNVVPAYKREKGSIFLTTHHLALAF